MIFLIRAKFSGSFFFTQRIFGAVKPAKAMLAVRRERVSRPMTVSESLIRGMQQ